MISTPEAFLTLQQQWPMRPPGGGQTARTLMEVGAVLLAILLLTLILVGGTYLVHRFLSGNRRRRSRTVPAPGVQTHSKGDDRLPAPRRRRRRRSRRRNPTLAETGGLPARQPDPSRSRQSLP